MHPRLLNLILKTLLWMSTVLHYINRNSKIRSYPDKHTLFPLLIRYRENPVNSTVITFNRSVVGQYFVPLTSDYMVGLARFTARQYDNHVWWLRGLAFHFTTPSPPTTWLIEATPRACWLVNSYFCFYPAGHATQWRRVFCLCVCVCVSAINSRINHLRLEPKHNRVRLIVWECL